jgi:hypothetical protein
MSSKESNGGARSTATFSGTRGRDCRYVDHLRESVGAIMSNIGRFGVLACVVLYGAIGLAGVFFLASQPGLALSTDGYGIAHPVARAMLSAQ